MRNTASTSIRLGNPFAVREQRGSMACASDSLTACPLATAADCTAAPKSLPERRARRAAPCASRNALCATVEAACARRRGMRATHSGARASSPASFVAPFCLSRNAARLGRTPRSLAHGPSRLAGGALRRGRKAVRVAPRPYCIARGVARLATGLTRLARGPAFGGGHFPKQFRRPARMRRTRRKADG